MAVKFTCRADERITPTVKSTFTRPTFTAEVLRQDGSALLIGEYATEAEAAKALYLERLTFTASEGA
jgi:hypothetical protein